MTSRIEADFIGRWRIQEMAAWDSDYLDMEEPAHISIRENLTGSFQFGLVQGELDGRLETVNGLTRLEFSWTGSDECDAVSGRGWLQVDDKHAEGHIFIHFGDDSDLKAVRE